MRNTSSDIASRAPPRIARERSRAPAHNAFRSIAITAGRPKRSKSSSRHVCVFVARAFASFARAFDVAICFRVTNIVSVRVIAQRVYVKSEIIMGMGLGLLAGAAWKYNHWQHRSKQQEFYAALEKSKKTGSKDPSF